MFKSILLIVTLIGMLSYKNPTYQPKDCDLIFQVAEMTNYSKAITDATAQKDAVKIDHVGMVVITDGKPYVLEATSKTGVSMTTLKDFIKRSNGGYIVKRIKDTFNASAVIEKAKSHLGEPYDWSYRPDNGKMYCSELIYESFCREDGTKIFQARPMNFRNAEGEMPQFWIDLFAKLGEEIPEGVIGTNPNDMSKEEVLEEIYRELAEE